MTTSFSSVKIGLTLLVVGLLVGFGIGYVYLNPRLTYMSAVEAVNRERLSSAEAKITELEEALRDAEAEKTRLETLLSTSQEALSSAGDKIEALNLSLMKANWDLSTAEKKITDLTASLSSAKERLSSAEAKITELEEALRDAEAEKTRLETLLSTLNTNLTYTAQKLLDREAELEGVLKDLEAAKEQILALKGEKDLREGKISDLKEALSKLDRDRILLIYLRMDLPDTRQLAHEHWSTVRDIAVQSDPSLGLKVDAIISYIDVYFDWVEAQPGQNASLEEITNWLFTAPPGAFEYGDAIDAFQKEALLVVITDIKTAVDLLD